MAIMNTITGHLVRRGIDIDVQYAQASSGGHRKHGDESLLTPLAIATLAFTSLIFLFTIVMVSPFSTPLIGPTNVSRPDTPTATSSPPWPWSRPPPPS